MNRIDGRYLKYLREKSGLSLRAFADKIYASKSSVQRWEKSFVPDDEELIKRIADVLGTTAEEMQEKSDLKYGAKSKNVLSPEQLADLKFGIKWLVIPIVGMFAVLAVVAIIFSII